MSDTPKLDPTTVQVELPRKRLQDEYHELGTWRKVASAHRVNVRYVYQYAIYGKIPHNRTIRRRLGIKRTVTINQLLRLPLADMPTEVLALALENRVEMSA